MKIETNNDGYDELHILAADARRSRRRANLTTTGLIVGGMIAASAYVSTTNDQVDQLAGESRDLREMVEQLKRDRDKRVIQLEQLQRERDFYKDNTESLVQAVPNFKLSDAVSKLSLIVPPSGTNVPPQMPDTVVRREPTRSKLANFVWIVDGSRRFPLAPGDILWIPEGDFSIRYDRGETVGGKTQHMLIRYEGEIAAGQEREGEELDPLPLATAEPFVPYREKVTVKGSTNCIEITLHEKSIRPGFTDSKFVDIEVLYSANEFCYP